MTSLKEETRLFKAETKQKLEMFTMAQEKSHISILRYEFSFLENLRSGKVRKCSNLILNT